MAWYFIILIVFGYILAGIITALIYIWYGADDDEAAILGFFWPIMLPIAILILPGYLIYLALEYLF